MNTLRRTLKCYESMMTLTKSNKNATKSCAMSYRAKNMMSEA